MILSSWLDGWRRALAAPAIAAGVFALTLASAVPLALVVRGAVAEHLGRSLAADRALESVDWDWWQEFMAQATGAASTLTPAVIGFAATLDHASSVLDGDGERLPIAAALAVYLLAWTCLTGGILDRYARQRPTGAYGFFGAAGRYAGRLIRLGALAAGVYWLLFSPVHAWLFQDAYGWLTRDLTQERSAFAWRAALYLVFLAGLLAVNVWFDFARVRLVVEDRRSVLGALRSAAGFIGRRPRDVAGLAALNGAALLAIVAVWALVAPGVGSGGAAMWAGLLVGQLYVIARLLLKLQAAAAQTALFQARLAHAAYTAVPATPPPASPAADTIVRRT